MKEGQLIKIDWTDLSLHLLLLNRSQVQGNICSCDDDIIVQGRIAALLLNLFITSSPVFTKNNKRCRQSCSMIPALYFA